MKNFNVKYLLLVLLFSSYCNSAQTKDSSVKNEAQALEKGIQKVNEQLQQITVYNFGFNEPTLDKTKFKQWKDKNLAVLKVAVKELPQGYTLELTGHTDNVGTEAYNLELGKKRAQFIANELVKEGVDRTKLTLRSMGYKNPIVKPGNSVKNRRVEFQVVR